MEIVETENPQAREAVKLPAIFLIITGVVSLLYALYSLVTNLTVDPTQMAEFQTQLQQLPEEYRGRVESFVKSGWLISVFWILTSGFVLLGGIKMLQRRSFGLSMAASIVAMVPCVMPGVCCCLGLPIGIWSLVVLNKPEVKSSFK